MTKKFPTIEKKIIKIILDAGSFVFEGETFVVDPKMVGKAISRDKQGKKREGEPKTDIFVQAKSNTGGLRKFKISFKLSDAAFPQNKITEEISEGYGITQNIVNAAMSLKDEFSNKDKDKRKNRALIHFERPSCGRGQEKNSRKLTLGWKCEANNEPRSLACEVTGEELEELLRKLYLGTNQPARKRNAFVNKIQITDSGTPNFFLQADSNEINTVEDIFDNLETPDEYINNIIRSDSKLFIIFTALNYFIDDGYIEKNRELWVWPQWFVKDGKICSELHFGTIRIAKDVVQNFIDCILELGIKPVKIMVKGGFRYDDFDLEQIRDLLHPSVLVHN